MSEKNEVGIESIKVNLGGETKSLTLEQARKLHEALGKLFPAPTSPLGSLCLRPHADEWRPYRPWYWFGSVCADTSGQINAPNSSGVVYSMSADTPQACFTIDLN